MVFTWERCYKFHQITLTILGLWPYQKSSVLRIQTIFFFSMFFAFLVFQFTIFVTTECDMEFIITELTYIFPTIIHVLSYNCFYFNSKIIKQLLEHIKLDWKTMKDNELKIIEKYTFNCYMFALYINILAGLGMLIFTIIEFIPVILDAIAPLNESRPRKLKVSYELFIDEEEYYFLYLLFEVLTVTVGIWSTITTGTFFIIIGGHCCATLKIASNLIQKAVTKNLLQLPAPHRIYFMYQNICRAVHIHRRTIKIMSTLLDSIHMWYFPLLLFGVISSSCIIFRVSNIICLY
ncbi:uncharacterized protein LOC105832725 [Monomorium pharaonis]|uniref:uncharacterized protein LOC105832725 n=1 Tax=Monomorium pharaonis TaxID=307658 RepID=UPI001747C121|nr:uncharacterized protein LOC105832725 [Monomorium pharaonis]